MARDGFRRGLEKRLHREGWQIARTNGGHLRYTPPNGMAAVIASSTPSDWRARHRLLADLRSRGFSTAAGPPLRSRRRHFVEVGERAVPGEQDIHVDEEQQGGTAEIATDKVKEVKMDDSEAKVSRNESANEAERTVPSFAATLRAERGRARLTAHELAVIIGVHHITVSAWEQGRYSPQPHAYEKLCEYLPALRSAPPPAPTRVQKRVAPLQTTRGAPVVTPRSGLGQKLHDERLKAGLSQQRVAQALGVAAVSVWRWENNRPMNADAYERLCLVLPAMRDSRDALDSNLEVRPGASKSPPPVGTPPTAADSRMPIFQLLARLKRSSSYPDFVAALERADAEGATVRAVLDAVR